MKYDVQFTVIIYNKKTYISHLAAIAIGLNQASMILFGNRTLIEVAPKDKSLIAEYPVYDLDSMLKSFVDSDKLAERINVSKKDCFVFDKLTFVPFSKINISSKYHFRPSLPAIKLFGAYYVVCNKQKDVNTRLVVIPE